jgi:hypothetical protein
MGYLVYGIWYLMFEKYVGYIYIVVSSLSKKMPCLAAEVRFLHYTFLSGHRLAGSILHTEQQFSFVHRQSTDHRQTIDRQSKIDNRQSTDHRQSTIDRQLKNEKIAFQINPCILLSAPRKRLSNNRTRKHTLASLCFYFQLVHIPITTSFFFTFKPKQSFHIICLHLEHRVDICYK